MLENREAFSQQVPESEIIGSASPYKLSFDLKSRETGLTIEKPLFNKAAEKQESQIYDHALENYHELNIYTYLIEWDDRKQMAQ